jgi:DNA polymerase III delta prime subunit
MQQLDKRANNNNNNNEIKHLSIHQDIINKMKFFKESKQIPNIIFHGSNGSGKHTLVYKFISDIYNNDKELIKTYVMNVNCAHGKGIKFVRDEFKFFAKTHINIKGSCNFKTIVLSNADKLTIDAQSAMRRCIELYSYNTRFFIIVEDKYKLLKPILSRFCEIFVPEPIVNGKKINLYQYVIDSTFKQTDDLDSLYQMIETEKVKWILRPFEFKEVKEFKEHLNNAKDDEDEDEDEDDEIYVYKDVMEFATRIYELGYSALDIISYLEKKNDIDELKRNQLLISFQKVKREIRNEKLLIVFMITFIFIRFDYNLENITFM